jgi:hypothetical protein
VKSCPQSGLIKANMGGSIRVNGDTCIGISTTFETRFDAGDLGAVDVDMTKNVSNDDRRISRLEEMHGFAMATMSFKT